MDFNDEEIDEFKHMIRLHSNLVEEFREDRYDVDRANTLFDLKRKLEELTELPICSW